MDLKDYRESGRDLYNRLRLPAYAVAIKYIKSESEIPEQAMRPSAMGMKWTICQAFSYARRWGWHVGITAKDNFCVPSSAIHRWVDITDEEFIESQVRQGWHKDRASEEARLNFVKAAFAMDKSGKAEGNIGLVCSPLHETIIEPDSILFFGDGSHITHIIHALCYEYKTPVTSIFEGFGESCMKGGLVPFITGSAQVIIPGMGDRSFGGISDHEIGIGIPGQALKIVMDNIFKTGGRQNMGQPVKMLLPMNLTESITPGFAYLKEKLEERESGKKK